MASILYSKRALRRLALLVAGCLAVAVGIVAAGWLVAALWARWCPGASGASTAAISGQLDTRGLADVPYIAQNPGFPTGCESVSAVMVLRFYGEDITVGRFVDEFLPQSQAFYTREGMLYGPDPRAVFVGDPRRSDSYGCYAPVIERAVTDYLRAAGRDADNRVWNTTGESLDWLCETFIEKGCPVLVWASMGMRETYTSASWIVPSGETFTWMAGEHCLVLVGVTDEAYVFHDPLAGARVAYDRQTVQQRYNELGRQSLVITA